MTEPGIPADIQKEYDAAYDAFLNAVTEETEQRWAAAFAAMNCARIARMEQEETA